MEEKYEKLTKLAINKLLKEILTSFFLVFFKTLHHNITFFIVVSYRQNGRKIPHVEAYFLYQLKSIYEIITKKII